MSEPMTDLAQMLRTLDVVARPAAYVFVPVAPGHGAQRDADAVIVEVEATTLVITEDRAREYGLEVGARFAWLTLTINSSLEAVGLTAAFSAALGKAEISCNVLAGFHHDHILVPEVDRYRAIDVLRELRAAG